MTEKWVPTMEQLFNPGHGANNFGGRSSNMFVGFNRHNQPFIRVNHTSLGESKTFEFTEKGYKRAVEYYTAEPDTLSHRKGLKKTKEGYIRVWRICFNPRHNDFNDEPEKIVVPYAIIKEKLHGYVVVRMGWGYGKKQQHQLPKKEFYFSPEEAEQTLQQEPEAQGDGNS